MRSEGGGRVKAEPKNLVYTMEWMVRAICLWYGKTHTCTHAEKYIQTIAFTGKCRKMKAGSAGIGLWTSVLWCVTATIWMFQNPI